MSKISCTFAVSMKNATHYSIIFLSGFTLADAFSNTTAESAQ